MAAVYFNVLLPLLIFLRFSFMIVWSFTSLKSQNQHYTRTLCRLAQFLYCVEA